MLSIIQLASLRIRLFLFCRWFRSAMWIRRVPNRSHSSRRTFLANPRPPLLLSMVHSATAFSYSDRATMGSVTSMARFV